MFQKILVAIDNNDIGRHVFDEALSLAKATNAHLMLLYVISPFEEQYLSPISIDPDNFYPTLHTQGENGNNLGLWERLNRDGLNFLTLLSNRAREIGVTVGFTQNIGDPGRMICAFARDSQADLIIVGRRGRRGLNEFFLGSVSNYVLHHAPCSVLTVQGPIGQNVEESQKSQVATKG